MRPISWLTYVIYRLRFSTAVDTGYDSWTLAATHSMSKRTMVYVGYNNIDADAGVEQDQFSVGMKHKF